MAGNLVSVLGDALRSGTAHGHARESSKPDIDFLRQVPRLKPSTSERNPQMLEGKLSKEVIPSVPLRSRFWSLSTSPACRHFGYCILHLLP